MKKFTAVKLVVARMMGYVSDSVENIVRKGENAGYQHFLLFPQCFQEVSLLPWFKVKNVRLIALTLYHTMTPFDALEEKAF